MLNQYIHTYASIIITFKLYLLVFQFICNYLYVVNIWNSHTELYEKHYNELPD